VVDFHDAGEDEAVEVRAQAADVCRQFEREHGDGAVGEVDAGAAEAGFLIEGGVGRDVLSDVGDVDLEFEIIVGEHADVDGVVEVAGGFSVDGDDGERAEVAAVAEFGAGDRGGDLLCFFQRGGGEMMREMEFADDDFDIYAEVVLAAEDFDNFAFRTLRGGRPVGDFYVYDYAFEVRIVGVAGGFFAEDSVYGVLLPLSSLFPLW
jgi:hypothetical protein